MKKMGNIKLVAVLFLSTMVPFFAYAQDDSPTWNVRRWEYHYFKEWRTEGDTVYGKVQEENIEFFYVSPIRKIALDGREYIFVGHEPMAFPMDSRSYRKEMTMSDPKRLRRSYSIGIRREDGRVYTNRDDFLYYQSYFKDNGYVSSPWLLSFSNPDYQPYHPFSRICNPTAANISICNAKSIADRELEKKELRIENADIHYGWITNPAERGAGEEGVAH